MNLLWISSHAAYNGHFDPRDPYGRSLMQA
jgi:hypothetical protein